MAVVAVTLIAGAGVLGFVNGQASSSEQNYNNNVAAEINCTNEQFAVTNLAFVGMSNNTLNVTAMNVGREYLGVAEVDLYNSTFAVKYTISKNSSLYSSRIAGCASTSAVPLPHAIAAVLQPGFIHFYPSNLKPSGGYVAPEGIIQMTLVLPGRSQFDVGSLYTVQVIGAAGNVVGQSIVYKIP